MKLPETMPDMLDGATGHVTDALRSAPWYRKLPLKLQIGLPMGLLFGAYFAYRFTGFENPGAALIIGGGVTAVVWTLAIGVTVFDHFETRKRRANKKAPVDFG